MDPLAASWFSELGLEIPIFSDQCDTLDFLDEDLSAALGEDFQCSLSPELNSSSSSLIPRCSSTTTLCASSAIEAPQQWPNSYNSSTIHNTMNIDLASPTPMIISFGNLNVPENSFPQQENIGMLNPEDDAVTEVLISRGSYVNLEEATKIVLTKKKNSRVRPPSQTYDHIIAERKRREQLSRQFVALSAIIPGLKKTDKTSVLGDAINYLKHLRERVKTLEEQTTKKSIESLVLVKKSQVLLEDEGSSDEQGSTDEQSLPQIEAKVCYKNVLLRIQCLKYKGVLVKVFSEIQKFNLCLTNTNVTPFGHLALDITIIAKMEREFNLTMEDLVRSLQSALKPNR